MVRIGYIEIRTQKLYMREKRETMCKTYISKYDLPPVHETRICVCEGDRLSLALNVEHPGLHLLESLKFDIMLLNLFIRFDKNDVLETVSILRLDIYESDVVIETNRAKKD